MDEAEIAKIKFLVCQFIEHIKVTGYSTRSQGDYPVHLKFFLNFLRGQDAATAADVTPETIHQYQMDLYRQTWKGRPLSLSTQYVRISVIKTFFRYLFKRGCVLADPTVNIEQPKRPKNLPKGILTVREVNRVLNQPDVDRPLGLRDRAILELLYSTGIRNSELRNAAVQDVDIRNQELRIRQGKGLKDRVVPVGEVAAGYLDVYVRNGRPRLLNGRGEGRAGHLLFVSVGGRRITAANLITLVGKYARRAGVKKRITPHSFRHTCATHMLKGRASLRHVQELLGHRSIATTQIYTHVEISDLKKEHQRCHPREQAR